MLPITSLRCAAGAALLTHILGGLASAQGIPVTGKPIPELAALDDLMIDFMTANAIPGGVLGVMKDGEIVYQRGFGWADVNRVMRHDAMLRIASVTKPITAATIRRLASEGLLSMDDQVFDLGQPGGGILDLTPVPDLGDERLMDITVQHLIDHEGGWNRGADEVDDLVFRYDLAAAAHGILSPPDPQQMMEWILSEPLQFDPGDGLAYSNIGFLALGLVIEEVTGESLYDVLVDRAIAPLPWTPPADLFAGRTFISYPREPVYTAFPALYQSVFPPYALVQPPYGSWDQEGILAFGGLVSSTTVLLRHADTYWLEGPSYGLPLEEDWSGQRDHSGTLCGSESLLVQRGESTSTPGVRYCVIFNAWNWNEALLEIFPWMAGNLDGDWYSTQMKGLMTSFLDGTNLDDWPTLGVEGEWVNLEAFLPGDGSFELPFEEFVEAVAVSPTEGTLNFLPATDPWTGTITKRIRFRAHGGSVVIGAQ